MILSQRESPLLLISSCPKRASSMGWKVEQPRSSCSYVVTPSLSSCGFSMMRRSSMVTATTPTFPPVVRLSWSSQTWATLMLDFTNVWPENDHGIADKVTHLEMADPPTIVVPLKETTFVERGSGQLLCRIDGYPAPSVKWSKDWRPLSETSRIYVSHEKPDTWTMNINNVMSMDEGQYMVVAENVAGKVHCSCRLTVEDVMPTRSTTDFKDTSNIEDDYYVLEELGRGRHGVVHRVIEKSTGNVYAAKFVRVRDDTEKDFFRTELETSRMVDHKNILSLHDAYETPKKLIMVNELLKGGSLLDRIIKSGSLSENGAAFYIRKLLGGLKELHKLNIVHMDIKPTNLMFPSPDSDELRLIDFGFAKKLIHTKDVLFNFGTPEHASPEQIDHEPVTLPSDMWSVGVLTYILLSGVSPFHDNTIRDSLIKTVDCDWEFDTAFSKISADAKDFISKLLVLDPTQRLTVDECLEHSWLKNTTDRNGGAKIDVGKLKTYQAQARQSGEPPMRTVADLCSLSKLLEGTPRHGGLHPEVDSATGKISFPGSEAYGEFLDNESWYDWQLRYQPGHESELYPTKDTDYSLRVRGYRRQAGEPDDSFELEDEVYGDDDYSARAPTVRERRLLSDVDKETLPPSLEKEMAWIADMREKRPKDTDEMSIASKRSSLGSVSTEGFPGPTFKAKLEDMAVGVGETITLCCHMMGPPMPTVAWYRNEELLSDGTRTKIGVCGDGRAYLTLCNVKEYDTGIYKCVARNKYGRSSCRCRLMIGEPPERPGHPVVTQTSSDEAFVIWTSPKSYGNSDILYYRIDYKKPGAEKWKTAAKVTTECAIATGLAPDTPYRFRVCAVNEFGPSPYSWGSVEVTSKPAGAPAITSDPEYQLRLLRLRQAVPPEPPASRWEVSEVEEVETEAELKKTKPEDVYNLGDTLWKGKFSQYITCNNVATEKDHIMRVVPLTKDNESDRLREFNILKGIQHNHVGQLLEGFQTSTDFYLVLEKMTGDNIARYLGYRRRYSEDAVVCVLRQVIDALQFLHRHGYAHLNLQPGSIIMANRQSLNIKLVDFSLVRKISPEGEAVPRMGYPDFMPPEVVAQEGVGCSADLWGLGVLAFLLLSGESPFSADTDDETLANIAYNRYNANDIYENVSKEGLKFIFKLLKRIPRNRPSLADCLDMKWMLQTDSIIKSRSETWFPTNKIRTFADQYDKRRMADDFRLDYTKVELTTKKPVESKRVRKERKPAAEPDQSVTESKKKFAPKVVKELEAEPDSEAGAGESEAAKSETTEEKIEQVADDVVSKALDEAMQSSELSSA
ncbi:obscurin-like [Haliotis rubra]|uniref:obscurin-like n=1 Tax=Haliotis rubra TaxID=36100 RepID=UPI001EE4F93F|nr:obscurin-like [Haliotis rubra]